jgi:hypothetical protein
MSLWVKHSANVLTRGARHTLQARNFSRNTPVQGTGLLVWLAFQPFT